MAILKVILRVLKGYDKGDPMSPYLFLLVMQAFSYILGNYMNRCEFVYHSKCKELHLSHLIFADDMFIMCGALVGSLSLVKQAIDEFRQLRV